MLAGQHRLELVAAEPADLAFLADHVGEALRDLLEERVADRMAQRVVDVLEPVEIDQEQGAAARGAVLALQRLVERAAHQHPVGQAGQRIIFGEAVDLLLRAALLGEIAADAAKAQEAAIFVEARRARQRPPDFGGGVGAHVDVGEGQAGREVEAQCALRGFGAAAVVEADQVGEGRADQVARRASSDPRRAARRRRRGRRARSSPRTSRGRPARTPR